ncbi:hypothetical protein J4751_21845 [Burkholderia pseudomallei]|nr:hypothetical protein [Burkholderia pseudomallei]MUV27991.1 hypothetical protein [Burkholderia thailandensis]MBF3632996.1 hypothetical protein [Burkholderia pseudomallei]MBF3700269.1 hypothetical protein [Burkholderia pseudomallei]MBF3721642.1 hypothetical protein [Burkholderia pseudomallei]
MRRPAAFEQAHGRRGTVTDKTDDKNLKEKKRWKDNLLSSSVPMEFEVSKLLVKHGFSTSADYSYTRYGAQGRDDFSVDLHASTYLPYRRPNEITTEFQLLIECKHRHRNNKWLFFPDPNPGEFSTFTLGHTLRVVDDFSPVLLESKPSTAFDNKANFCLKGVEIDLNNGTVHDAEIRRGLAQLQYALPRLVTEAIEWNLGQHPEECCPFLYCPILLTTSEIVVAKTDTTIASVEKAEALSDLATPVPWVVVYCEQTQDFQRHRQATCDVLSGLVESGTTDWIDGVRKKAGVHDFALPSAACEELAGEYSRGRLGNYFGQFIVCSLPYFESLLKKLKTVASKTDKTRKNLWVNPAATTPE